MKTIFFLFLIIIVHIFLGGETVATFSEPIDPTQLLVDDRYIYVVDFPFIYLYSTSDYTLKKKIGEQGEGPKQFHYFRGSLVNKTDAFKINIESGKMIVSSQGKVTFYSQNGIYQKEIRTNHRHDHKFFPVKNKFLGLTARREADNLFYIKLFICNDRLIPEKEIFTFKRFSQPPRGDINVVYDKGVIFDVCQEKIFVTAVGRENSLIDVFDMEGKKIYSISYNYERPVVTQEDKNQYLDYYRAGPLKFVWDRFKKQIKFPVYFPGLNNFCTDSMKIYVVTFKRIKDKNEMIIFDIKGKFLKKIMVPLQKKDIYFYPYTIHRGKLYQLVEREDDEKWEVKVCDLR
jgi:hypothetical protein